MQVAKSCVLNVSWVETSKEFWTIYSNVGHPHIKKSYIFSFSMMACISVWAHFLLLYHQIPLNRVIFWLFFGPSRQVIMYIYEIPPEPSLLSVEQSQMSQHFLIWETLPSWHFAGRTPIHPWVVCCTLASYHRIIET